MLRSMIPGMEASQVSPSARGAFWCDCRIVSATATARDGPISCCLGDAIQRLLLVKARHFDRPFDRGAASTRFQEAPVVGTRDRDNPPVEFRGIACIDFQFLFTGPFTLLERRVVEKRQPHRAFDLQGTIAAEEDHRGMGIDPLAPPCRAESGVFEKIKHTTLELLESLSRYRWVVAGSWL